MHAFTQNSNYRTVGIIVGLLLLWMLSGLIFGGSDNSEQENKAEKTAVVAIQSLQAQAHQRKIILMARTEADEAANLITQVDGRIVEKPVDRGSLVAKDDLIVRIETAGRAASVEAAQARVKAAGILVDAARRLSTQGFKAASTLAEREAELGAAKEALATAKLNLERTRLTSPFDGKIDALNVDVGDTVSIGEAIGTLVGTGKFLVVAYAAQSERDNIQVGQPFIAKLVNGQTVEGKIRFVAQEADPQTLTYRVDAEVINSETLPVGMATELTIPYAEVQAHFIPHSAVILGDEGELQVRTEKDGVAHSNVVTLLEDTDKGLWVAGLPIETNLIVRGQLAVSEGEKVEAKQAGAGE